MAEYSYKTPSGACEAPEGTEVTPENCKGKFTVVKSMSESSRPEKCRFCGCNLVKDFKSQGAPGAEFIGQGFYCNENRRS